MYDLMLACIVLIAIMFVTYVAITVYEIVVERHRRKNPDGENDKEVYVINPVSGGRVDVAIGAGKVAKKTDEEKPSVDLDKKVCYTCGNTVAEETILKDNKTAYSAKNDDKTCNERILKEKKFNSEFLILPEGYYSLSVTECYFYDEIVRFAYKCGADGRYRREGGEEIRKGDIKMAEVRIIGGSVYCAVGDDKLKKVGSFQNLQSVKNALESSFAKK